MENKYLNGIDTIIIRVKDIEVSKGWYKNKLGLTPVWEDISLKLVVLDTKGPTSLTIWQTAQPIMIKKETTCYPIFRTQNIDELKEQFNKEGIQASEIIEDDHVRYLNFYDPDGNVLEACQIHN